MVQECTEENLDIARRLLLLMTDEDIAQVTELPLADIQKLRQE